MVAVNGEAEEPIESEELISTVIFISGLATAEIISAISDFRAETLAALRLPKFIKETSSLKISTGSFSYPSRATGLYFASVVSSMDFKVSSTASLAISVYSIGSAPIATESLMFGSVYPSARISSGISISAKRSAAMYLPIPKLK